MPTCRPVGPDVAAAPGNSLALMGTSLGVAVLLAPAVLGALAVLTSAAVRGRTPAGPK